jgi:hypothetical protein
MRFGDFTNKFEALALQDYLRVSEESELVGPRSYHVI